MNNMIAILLFVAILTSLGVVVRWEYKRATKEPRLRPIEREGRPENPLSIYVPMERVRRTFEPAARA